MTAPLDEDVLIAAVDLVGRAGARELEVGYLNDEDDPAFAVDGPAWWAHAAYGGHRITVERFDRPDAAVEALAVKILTGAKCRCGRLVALSDDGADGAVFTTKAAGQCRWRRDGRRWEPSCDAPPLRRGPWPGQAGR